MKEELLPIVADPKAYSQVFSFSFGVWMDHDWRKNGWHEDDPGKNYFTPAAFQTAARAALETAGEYVWIYSETPRWWSADGKAVKLPQAYTDALLAARKGIAAD